jgi:hypothetical protein
MQATDTDIRDLLVKIGSQVDAVQGDLVEIKISQARTDERINSIDTQLTDIKAQRNYSG